MEKIDFVVTWVDCNDPAWIESYNLYRPEKPIHDMGRFRNWGLFRYWFRAVEKFAPWVNKVYLVTNGKFPDWINSDCEKLVLVKHADYMPTKYLPTFNSNAIELNFGRIEALSEHFVYFNDDMFINAPVEPEYFFKNGLPCDNNFETLFHNSQYNNNNGYGLDINILCCIAVLNKHFNRRSVVRQAWKKWYGPHLWGRALFMSIILLGRSCFENFALSHIEQPMLKSVFKEIWEKEETLLDHSCTQFREDTNLTQYLIRYWQFASNRFYPTTKRGLTYHNYNKDIVADIIKNIKEDKFKSICINDSPLCSIEEYQYASQLIREAFEEKFPRKSIYEK